MSDDAGLYSEFHNREVKAKDDAILDIDPSLNWFSIDWRIFGYLKPHIMLSMIWKVWLLLLLLHIVASWPQSREEDQIILQRSFCSIGLCLTTGCIQCSNYTSVCQTHNETEPIPSTLPKTTTLMLLWRAACLPHILTYKLSLCMAMFVTIFPATFRSHQ